jgi:hypothetical protein
MGRVHFNANGASLAAPGSTRMFWMIITEFGTLGEHAGILAGFR